MNERILPKEITLPRGYTFSEDNVGRVNSTDMLLVAYDSYISMVDYAIYRFKTATQVEMIVAGSSCFLAYLLIYVIFQCLSLTKNSPTTGNATDKEEEQDDSKVPPRDFTIDQLRCFTGEGEGPTPIYIALKGDVYDVSSAANFYGPGNGYHCFAGRDASRAMAKLSFEETDLNNLKIDDLSPFEKEQLNSWVDKFKYYRDYPIVGRVSEAPKDLFLSLEDMVAYNGSMPVPAGRVNSPLYVSLNGNIYDVSYGGYDLYCHGAAYSCFAGKDISKALAKMSKSDDDINNLDLSDLSEAQLQTLSDWEKKYSESKKYPRVGRLKL